MIIGLINRILRNRVKSISFPKLSTKEYNKLWKVTTNKFIKLPIMEIFPIVKSLIYNYGAS